MKLNINTTEVQGVGFESVSDFKVAMNAKAFKVLSDQLYKDKIGSIVRELSCNAFDSHVAADNQDVPFDIHLPDTFEPYFYIRDYGTGISHDNIIQIYTTYFESTKDDANDEVGAFGLGSKTPFSYTDSFTVISIHNGVKTMYNAHMSEGLPRMVQYGESEETDEPDGLEVNVSVESVDYKAFSDAVKRQLKFFPVKPNILNGQIEWDEFDTVLDVPGFRYYTITNAPTGYGSKRSPSAGLFIKQGPVGYPIDFDIIDQYLNSNGINPDKFYNYLKGLDNSNNNCLVFDMPIGTVEVTASREGISYTDTTIRNILTKFIAVGKVVAKDVKRSLDQAYKELTPIQFIRRFNELDHYFLSALKVEDLNEDYPKFEFATQAYRNTFTTPKLKVDKKFNGIKFRRYDAEWRTSKPKLGATHTFEAENDEDYFCIPLNYFKYEKVYVKDLNQGFVARMSNDNSERTMFMMEIPSGISLQDVIDVIGDDIEFIPVSKLPEPPKASRAGRDGHSITGGRKRAWFNIDSRHVERVGFWDQNTLYAMDAEQIFTEDNYDDVVDKNTKYVYFITYNNKVSEDLNNIDLTQSRLAMFVSWLYRNDYKVIGIAKNDVNTISKKGDFAHINDVWQSLENKYYDSVWNQFVEHCVDAYYATMAKYLYSGNTGFYRNVNSCDVSVVLSELEDIGVDVDRLKEYNKNLEDYSGFSTAISFSFASLLDEVLTNGKKALAQEIKGLYLDSVVDREMNQNVTRSILHFESLLRKAGVKLDYRYSKFVNKFTKAVTDNIQKLVNNQLIENGSVNLNRFIVRCPVTDDELLTTKELSDELK